MYDLDNEDCCLMVIFFKFCSDIFRLGVVVAVDVVPMVEDFLLFGVFNP